MLPLIVHVEIREIVDQEMAKIYIVREIIKYRDYTDMMHFSGKRIVNLDKKQTVYWLSGKYMIYIFSRDTTIPKELLDDYLKKYPPTYTFTSADLDVQKMLKTNMKRRFETIYDLDDDRGWTTRKFNKSNEYKAMMHQCRLEQVIRCELGGTDDEGKVGCPISFILDDSKREDEWKKLEKETKQKPIHEDKVDLSTPDRLTFCKSSIANRQEEVMKALNMNESDLPKEARMPR